MTTSYLSTEYPPAEDTRLRIVSGGELLTLDYGGAITAHPKTLWWGAAVGYRAMQAAAVALSQPFLWQRQGLYVVSGHPGPGVLDSLNYVTHCRDEDRMRVLENPRCQGMCNAEMKFEWWVCDGQKTAHVILREDFVPRAFYELTERLFDVVTNADKRLFEEFKVVLSAKIWNAPLEESFQVKMEPPIAVGAIPETTDWNPQVSLNTELV